MGEQQKPEALMFYNSGKSGVDTKNGALYYYNAKRISRWPHAVLCYLLSLLTDNAFVLYKDVRPDDVRTIRDSGRKDFIIRLSEGLTRCKMASRLPDVGFLLREIMHEKYGIQRPIPQPLPEPQQPSRAELCHICRRSRKKCTRCRYATCQQCATSQYVCNDRAQCRR